MTTPDAVLDVLILGGGPAGLSAALYLGRSRRQVVVLDAGSPRHAVSDGIHNFITREGFAPAALREETWAQMAPYTSVKRALDAHIVALTWSEEHARWSATARDGRVWHARAALIATGVVDEHPEILGYAERWGSALHHCPFCHGWEMRDRPLAVLASSAAFQEHATHLAIMLQGWSQDVVVLTHGAPLGEEMKERLKVKHIQWDERRVVSLEGPGAHLERVVFEEGGALERQGMFVAAPQHLPDIVSGLGLKLTEAGYVEVDMQQQTSCKMLWAAGDVTSRMQQVIESAAQGGRAGAMIHATLTFA